MNAIGPFWDGNEVWLIVAGAAMFAAFPAWYATLFSALYLGAAAGAGRADRPRGGVRVPRQDPLAAPARGPGRVATTVASALLPLVLGIGLGDLVAGLPVGPRPEFTGNFLDIFTAYGVWTGLTLLALSALHGATFLGAEDHRGGPPPGARAGGVARARGGARGARPRAVEARRSRARSRSSPPGSPGCWPAGREGWAFTATALAMAAA